MENEKYSVEAEIERILSKDEDLLEAVKNTIVSMLNVDYSCHEEMADFCLKALEKHESVKNKIMTGEEIVEVFKRHGMTIELGAQFSVKGQIVQLINGVEECSMLDDEN